MLIFEFTNTVMKLPKAFTLKEISELLACEFVGNSSHSITGINEIHMVEAGDIVFVDHPKYYEKALNSAATTIIIDKIVPCPEGKALLISEKPFDSYNWLTQYFSPLSTPADQVSQFIDDSAIIYPNVFIGKNVRIGKNTRIYSGVSILDNTEIGDDVVIGANTVIGHFAFYYKKKSEGYERMHTCGGVKIEDNVEIGGLLLCKTPKEFVDQRNAHFSKLTQSQTEAVDNNLMRQSDARMPLFRENKSSSSFGKGT